MMPFGPLPLKQIYLDENGAIPMEYRHCKYCNEGIIYCSYNHIYEVWSIDFLCGHRKWGHTEELKCVIQIRAEKIEEILL